MKRPTIRNLIQNDGLTRQGRFLEELDPLFAKIDDRGMADLLAFAWKHSDHLHFHEVGESGQGEEVRRSGSWQQLLRHEQLFCLALISGSSPVSFSRRFEEALQQLDPENDSVNQWEDKMFDAFVEVVALCEEVDSWSTRLPIGSRGARDLKVYIGQLEDRVEQLLALYRLKIANDKLWVYVSTHLNGWNIDKHGAPVPGGALLTDDQVVIALRNLFGEMQTVYSAIVNNARQLIEISLAEDTHQAHFGLFLAFLRLLEHNREHLNKLTGRHLDFYLRDILKFEPRERMADAVNLTFELVKKLDRHLLKAGTAFKGGKNEDKIERLYDLKNELSLSRAQVVELKNIYLKRSGGTPIIRGVHIGIAADSLDGLGEPLPEDNPKWPGFGTSTYPLAELGLAVSSPLLRLAEGERQVIMTFTLKDLTGLEKAFAEAFGSATEDEVQVPDFFSAMVTTSKGWYDCIPSVQVNRKSLTLSLLFSFDMDVPAIVDFDAEKLADPVPLPADWPVFRLTVNQQDHAAAYHALASLQATSLHIEIVVDKLRDLVLGNDASKLKADKPFAAFGSQPHLDSTFFIGHAETFAKPLTNISLSWNWLDAPKNLEDYYQNYTEDAFQFTADVDLRENFNWDHSLGKGVALSIEADPDSFGKIAKLSDTELKQVHQTIQGMTAQDLTTLKQGGAIIFPEKIGLTNEVQKALQHRFVLGKKNATLNLGASKPRRAVVGETSSTGRGAVIEEDDSPANHFVGYYSFDISGYDFSHEAEPFDQYSETLRQGGLRFRLKSPDFAFGHKAYSKLHSQAVTAALRNDSPDPSLLETLQLPYTPMFENLELSYRAEKTFDLSKSSVDLDVLLLLPFGYKTPVQAELVANYTSEGSLYIGLGDLLLPQNLSLLIQLAEGSGDPFISAPQSIQWSYLTDTGWTKFTRAEILQDATLGFLQSGIIELSLPKAMSADNPEMPWGRHWLRVTVSDNTTALHDVLAVIAQAGVAVYRDEGHRAGHLATALPAGTVAKMLVRDTNVKTINQPFASYGGREAESDTEFRTRGSERLRHKDRAVGLWDYEHLVIDRFPEVHKVKCLNHTCPESEFAPGNITLVLIPDLRNRNSRYPLRPAVQQSVLERVKLFVLERCSAHVTVHVVNPFYERIAIGGMVHFLKGFDQGIYQKKLHQDITNGLTPWLRGARDIHFGGRIHSSVILNLIEELPYVDYLSTFTVNHYVGPDDAQGRQVDEVIATSNRSILVSNDSHTIQGVSPQ